MKLPSDTKIRIVTLSSDEVNRYYAEIRVYITSGWFRNKTTKLQWLPFEPQLSNDNVINTRNVSMYDDKDDLKQEINKFRIRSMLCDISYENV